MAQQPSASRDTRFRFLTAMTNVPETLPISRQWTYATGQLGWSILANIVGINLVFFYLPPDTAGLPTLIASTTFLGVLNAVVLIAASGRLLDAITDPLIASFSDRLRSNRGRRIPFMTWAAIPAAVFLTLMFIPPSNSTSGWNIVWLVVVQALFYVALTAYVTPFFALLPELGHTVRERLNLSTWISITFALGIILGGSVPLLAGVIEGAAGVERLRAYQYAIAGLALLAIVLMFVPVWTIDERRYAVGEPSSVRLGEAIRSTFRNVHFRYYVVADFAYWTGLTIIQTGLLFYVTVLLLEAESLVGTLLTVFVLVSFLFYPVVNLAAARLGKKPLMVASFIIMGLIFVSIWFLGDLQLSPLVQAYGIVVLFGVPVAFLSVLPNAVLADIAEADAVATGDRQEGMFFAARTLMQKLGQTTGVVLFAMLTTLGSDVGDDLGIRLSGLVGCVLCIVAGLVFTRYDEAAVIGQEV